MHQRVTQTYARPQMSPDQLAAFAEALGALVNRAIDVLDVIASDPDEEMNGDELDGTCAEDEAGAGGYARLAERGPGCGISDPDCCSARDDTGSTWGAYDGRPGDPDDAEDGHDDEIQTWSSELDHPGELFVGRRPDPARVP